VLRDEVVGNAHTAFSFCWSGRVCAAHCVRKCRESAARRALAGKGVRNSQRPRAPRIDIVRRMLTESMLLAIVGGALGILLARWSIATLIAHIRAIIPRLNEIAIDLRVLASRYLFHC